MVSYAYAFDISSMRLIAHNSQLGYLESSATVLMVRFSTLASNKNTNSIYILTKRLGCGKLRQFDFHMLDEVFGIGSSI